MIDIELARQHPTWNEDDPRIVQAVRDILRDHGVRQAQISLAVVDDATIHDVNRRYLNHDYATDVLSFLLESEGDRLEGEIVVSADTASETARGVGWPAADELLLYVVHATLHLVGYDDAEPTDRDRMRDKERHYLQAFGLNPCYESDSPVPEAPGSAAGRSAAGEREAGGAG
jgi:probable rRNA maturation factor